MDEQTSVADQIKQYLLEHPRGRDTAEGIVQWWLSEPWTYPTLVDTKLSLSALTPDSILAVPEPVR
jgi:hypothetical protein